MDVITSWFLSICEVVGLFCMVGAGLALAFAIIVNLIVRKDD